MRSALQAASEGANAGQFVPADANDGAKHGPEQCARYCASHRPRCGIATLRSVGLAICQVLLEPLTLAGSHIHKRDVVFACRCGRAAGYQDGGSRYGA